MIVIDCDINIFRSEFKMEFLLINKKLVFSTLLIIIVALLIQQKWITNNFSSSVNKSNKLILTQEELSIYDGILSEKLYLGVIGSIFDVSSGAKYYAKGNSYHYFVGKDGTRALVSGNFIDESEEKDHILDLKCDDIFAIMHWKKTFRNKYKYIGILEGRYYSSDGTETDYMRELKNKLKKCREEKEKLKQQDLLYPPCNIAWSEVGGTRVWCSESSGGVVRNWIGVPRQLYSPGNDRPTCVCVQEDSNMLKEYDGCSSTASECFIQVD